VIQVPLVACLLTVRPAPGLRRDWRSRTVADVDPFRGLGMPGIPGLGDVLSLMQKQTEALAQLPRTLTDLNGAIRDLTDATALARETIESAQRITERLESLVEELQQPVRALKPGLERVGRVLDDPAVDTVPETLRRIHDDLMPLISGLRQAQARVGSVTGKLRRRQRSDDANDLDH
jgi:chromosome segregation ATPase